MRKLLVIEIYSDKYIKGAEYKTETLTYNMDNLGDGIHIEEGVLILNHIVKVGAVKCTIIPLTSIRRIQVVYDEDDIENYEKIKIEDGEVDDICGIYQDDENDYL